MRTILVIISVGMFLGVVYFFMLKPNVVVPSPMTPLPTTKPLLKYTYKNLRNYKGEASEIFISKKLKDEEKFASYLFYFYTAGNKKVSGLMNVPKDDGTYPIAVLIRGFVDPSVYETGIGSQRVGEYFASNGFITLSPDFLGYGTSDKPVDDAFEDRFMTYTTTIDLISSLKNLNEAFADYAIGDIKAEFEKVGIWGHSNGGQIAISVAEILGHRYPTVIWAPVSKPFPYSILYFTDEFEDKGKALRKSLAIFENTYDVEDYSITNFYKYIKAPIQIHQGEVDEAVPLKWSENLYKTLKNEVITVEYYAYPGENHNFQNGTWPLAVSRSVSFIRHHLSK